MTNDAFLPVNIISTCPASPTALSEWDTLVGHMNLDDVSDGCHQMEGLENGLLSPSQETNSSYEGNEVEMVLNGDRNPDQDEVQLEDILTFSEAENDSTKKKKEDPEKTWDYLKSIYR